jgi:hypothetical protein
MTSLLTAAKNEYLLEQGHNYMHDETISWLSDLEFCRTELAFLTRLLDKTFLRVKSAQKISDLIQLEKKVKTFRMMSVKALHDEVVNYERELSLLDENKFLKKKQSFFNEHEKHELAINRFMNEVKEMKMEVFKFVETEIKSEKNK